MFLMNLALIAIKRYSIGQKLNCCYISATPLHNGRQARLAHLEDNALHLLPWPDLPRLGMDIMNCSSDCNASDQVFSFDDSCDKYRAI